MQTDVEEEIAALQYLSIERLKERYQELCGEETRSRNRKYLVRKLAWRIQALAEGDLSVRARQRAADLANDADARRTPPKESPLGTAIGPAIKVELPTPTDGRLPAPGAAIVRNYKGRKVQVVVLTEGFEYGGEHYKSLSAVAKAITGTHCNGFRFFGLEAKSNE